MNTNGRLSPARFRIPQGASRFSWIGYVLLAFTAAALVKALLVQVFWVPSGSMEPEFVKGDRILVEKLSSGEEDISRGDILVFDGTGNFTRGEVEAGNPAQRALSLFGLIPPVGEENFVKRVVGLPGDHVVCCDRDGQVTVNGEPLDEPYIYPGNEPSNSEFDVTVPEGELWMMGDHRAASSDSRERGFVPIDRVVGRVVWKVWPLSDFGSVN